MKQWFPFTDYDFYAYLTAGVFLLLGLDLAITGGSLMLRPAWTIVEVVIVIAAAYVVGQIAAGPSSTLLEHVAARRMLHPPMALLLGLAPPRLIERAFSALFVGRGYGPLPKAVREAILASAAKAHGIPTITDPEEVFQVAFPAARAVPDTVARIDQFRNLYGFARNVSFVALVSTIALAIRWSADPLPHSAWMTVIAAVIAIGMFGRFLKFYAEFATEVLRAYHAKLAADAMSKKP